MPSTDFNSKTLGQTVQFLIFRLINFYKLVKRIWDKPCWCDASSFGIIPVTLVGSWARLDNRDELRWKLHCLGRLTVAHHCLKLGWWVDGVLNKFPTPNSHAACQGHCWRIWNWRGQKVRASASMSSFSDPETGEYDQDHPCSLEKAALVHSFGHFGNRYWHVIPSRPTSLSPEQNDHLLCSGYAYTRCGELAACLHQCCRINPGSWSSTGSSTETVPGIDDLQAFEELKEARREVFGKVQVVDWRDLAKNGTEVKICKKSIWWTQ